MTVPLFSNFLNDVDEYHLSEEYWSCLCDEVLARYSGVRDWKPWSSKCSLNGTPFLDGNPIHDLVSFSSRKGLRIIQEEPQSSDLQLSAWTDTFGGDPGEEGTWDELVISCALSEESAELARQLLIEWVQYDGPHKEFKPTIDRILNQ